jgi:hypothetical protein
MKPRPLPGWRIFVPTMTVLVASALLFLIGLPRLP